MLAASPHTGDVIEIVYVIYAIDDDVVMM